MSTEEPNKNSNGAGLSGDHGVRQVSGSEGMELPDYVDEDAVPPSAGGKWYANPENWKYIALGLVMLLLLLSIPSLYRMLKGWRAGMIMNASASAFAVGDDERAVSLMKQALALSPGSDSVQHAVELYNARVGDKTSLQKLLERMNAGLSDREELLGIAELGARQGQWDVTREAVAKLPSVLGPSQRMRKTLIQALIKKRDEGPESAAAFCLEKAQSVRGEDSARLRNQAALYLLSVNHAASARRGGDILLGVMREKSSTSLAAARMLARLSLQNHLIEGGGLDAAKLMEVSRLLPVLPGHQTGDVLLAADLEIKADPSSKEAVVQRIKGAFHNAPRQELLELARWLNANGLYDQVISLAGKDNPYDDTDWMLIVLDAQSAQENWPVVERMLSSPAGAGIPEAVRHLYLARVATMRGNTAGAEEEWRSVSGSLQREKPDTLNYIAGYEERIGAFDRAARTYRTMADRAETRVPGLVGLIRSQPVNASASVMIPLYEELNAAAPQFSEATGDLAYLKLLKKEDVQGAFDTSVTLLSNQPDSLARLSAVALGYLRKDDPGAAAQIYRGKQIDWAAAPEPWKAVRVAVLRASGDPLAADALLESVDSQRLRPEERELLMEKLPVKAATKPKK